MRVSPDVNDLFFFSACGVAGIIPATIVLLMKKSGSAIVLALASSVLSVLLLWPIGLGPHGFILFAFMPLLVGNVAALIWALVRFNKERTPA